MNGRPMHCDRCGAIAGTLAAEWCELASVWRDFVHTSLPPLVALLAGLWTGSVAYDLLRAGIHPTPFRMAFVAVVGVARGLSQTGEGETS